MNRVLALATRPESLGFNSGRRAWRPAGTLAPSLSSAMRVINGIHNRASYMRLPAPMGLATCLAKADVLLVRVAYPADSRPAGRENIPHFACWKASERGLAL